jgi:hypothetical protein
LFEMGYKRLSPGEKFKTLPAKYTTAFVWNLDLRSPIGQRAVAELLTLADALGGWDAITPQEKALVTRATYLALKCAEFETADLQGLPTPMEKGTYSNFANVLSGILTKLGTTRRARPTQGLQEYLAGKRASS